MQLLNCKQKFLTLDLAGTKDHPTLRLVLLRAGRRKEVHPRFSFPFTWRNHCVSARCCSSSKKLLVAFCLYRKIVYLLLLSVWCLFLFFFNILIFLIISTAPPLLTFHHTAKIMLHLLMLFTCLLSLFYNASSGFPFCSGFYIFSLHVLRTPSSSCAKTHLLFPSSQSNHPGLNF